MLDFCCYFSDGYTSENVCWSIQNVQLSVSFPEMGFFFMFIPAVCMLFLIKFTFLAVVADPGRFTQTVVADSAVHTRAVVLTWMLEAEIRNYPKTLMSQHN